MISKKKKIDISAFDNCGNTWVAYMESVGGLAPVPHGYLKNKQKTPLL